MEEKTNSVDVIALIKTIWSARKKVIKWAIAGFAIGVVIAFSIPKQYAATVKLAPETQAKALAGSPSKMMIIVAFTMLTATLCAVVALKSINDKRKSDRCLH